MSVNGKQERSQVKTNLSSQGFVSNEKINITTLHNKGDIGIEIDTGTEIERRIRNIGIMTGKNPSLCPHILQEYFKRVGEVIQAYRPQIVQYVKYEQVSESLIKRGILRMDENSLIQEIETREMQMGRILDILKKRMWGLENLITVLIEINVESWIVEEMFQKYVQHIVNEIRRLQSLKSCKCFEHERRSIIRKAVIRFFEKCDEWLYSIGTSMGFLTLTIYPNDNVLQFINNLLPIPREKNDDILSIPEIEFVHHKINDASDCDDGTVDIIELQPTERRTSSSSGSTTKPLTDRKLSSLSTLSTDSKIRGRLSKSPPTKLSTPSSTKNMHMEEKSHSKAIQTSMSEPTTRSRIKSINSKSKSPTIPRGTSDRFTPIKPHHITPTVLKQMGTPVQAREFTSVLSPAETSMENIATLTLNENENEKQDKHHIDENEKQDKHHIDENESDNDNDNEEDTESEYCSQIVLLPINIKFLSKNGTDPTAFLLNSIPNFQHNSLQKTPITSINAGQIDSWMNLSNAVASHDSAQSKHTQSTHNLHEISNDATKVPHNLTQDSARSKVTFKPLPVTQPIPTSVISQQNDESSIEKNLKSVHTPLKEVKNMKPETVKPLKILPSRLTKSTNSKITSKLSPSSKILHKGTSQPTKPIKKSTVSPISKTRISKNNVKSVGTTAKKSESEVVDKEEISPSSELKLVEKHETEKTEKTIIILDGEKTLCESSENGQIISLNVSKNQEAAEASNFTPVVNEAETNDTQGSCQVKESAPTVSEAEDLTNNKLILETSPVISKLVDAQITNSSISKTTDLNTSDVEEKFTQPMKSTEENLEKSALETPIVNSSPQEGKDSSVDKTSPEVNSTAMKSSAPLKSTNSTKVVDNKIPTKPILKSPVSSISKPKQSSAPQKFTTTMKNATVNSSIRKIPVTTTVKSTRVSVLRAKSEPEPVNKKNSKVEETKKKTVVGKPILKNREKTLENKNETIPSKEVKVVKINEIDCNNNNNNSPNNNASDLEQVSTTSTNENENDQSDVKPFNSTLVLDTLNKFPDSAEKFPILKKNLVDLNGTFGEIRGKINSLSNLLSEKKSKYFPTNMRRTKSDSLISTQGRTKGKPDIRPAVATKIRINSESATDSTEMNNDKIIEKNSSSSSSSSASPVQLESEKEPQKLNKKWKNTVSLNSQTDTDTQTNTESHSDISTHVLTAKGENNEPLSTAVPSSSSSTSSLDDCGQSKLLVDAASQTVLKMKATSPISPVLSRTPLRSSSSVPAVKSPAAVAIKNGSYSSITSKVDSNRSPITSTGTATNSSINRQSTGQRVAKVTPNQTKPGWNSSKKPSPPPPAPERVTFSNIDDYNFTMWTNNWQAKADQKRNDEELANLIQTNK